MSINLMHCENGLYFRCLVRSVLWCVLIGCCCMHVEICHAQKSGFPFDPNELSKNALNKENVSNFSEQNEPLKDVFIKGNVCVEDAVLVDLIRPMSKQQFLLGKATMIRKRLLEYYMAKGYRLVRVWTKIHRGKIYVSIDEGRLEKIIIRGRDPLQTSLMHLTIKLPFNVYNQYVMEEELEKLKKRFWVKHVSVQFDESPPVTHAGWQLSDQEFAWFPKAGAYEMHVLLGIHKLSDGPGLELRMESSYGVVPEAFYRHSGFFFDEGDDFRIGLASGYWVRKSLNTGDYGVDFTYVGLNATYDFPKIADLLQFNLAISSELSKYQRTDLPLDSYWDFSNQVVLGMQFDVYKGLNLGIGVCGGHKNVFSIEKVVGKDFYLNPFRHWRFSVPLTLEYDWSEDEIRRDRHSNFSFSFVPYLVDVSIFYRFDASYQHLFDFGYHDLWLKARTVITLEPSVFYDEVPLAGKLLRSFYSESYYIDNASWLSLEFRGSIYRDIWKLSIYHDFALFRKISHDPKALQNANYRMDDESTSLAWANSFGPGVHWLILDSFQLDLYCAFGFAPSGFAVNPYFRLLKVF